MKKSGILIIDDNKNVLSALKIFLCNHFRNVYCISTPNTILANLREYSPDIILLDMNFSSGINNGNEGLFWLSEIKKYNRDIPVVLFTAYADIELAVNSLKNGASDFIVKPWDNRKLLASLQSILNRSGRGEKPDKKLANDNQFCWGQSVAMQKLLSVVKKVSLTDANILITGENGTGKEVIARYIHTLSNRKNENLVTVDMGAISETLFESELFGHVKGAFTDAKADRAGKFEVADNGTLFLDEIGNLNYSLQVKLLTALQSRRIVRVGSNSPIEVNIRLVSATNRDLFKSVEEGEFREDLLYRINTIQIEVPPLRDRKEDIPLLAGFFLQRFAEKYNRDGLSLGSDAIGKLQSYTWPGNVRELEHAIEKAVILSGNKELTGDDFYMRASKETGAQDVTTIEDMEKDLIRKAICKHNNNISAVAEELGITRPTLYSKIKKYGL